MRWIILSVAFLSSLVLFAPAPVHAAEDRVLLGLGAFAFDEKNEGDLAAEVRLEYLSGWRLLDQTFGPRFGGLGPYAALSVNTDGGVFGSGGLFLDLQPFKNVYVRPFGGVGGYSEGGARELGGVFQFETGAAVAYRFESQTELGLIFKHISNAGIHDDNPGVNSLMLTVSVPLGRLLSPLYGD